MVKPVARAPQPKFVNTQVHAVGVITPDRKKVYVQPFAEHGTIHQKKDAVYILEGEFYAEQVHPKGPLAPFPEPAAKSVPAPAPTPVPTSTASLGAASAATAGQGGAGAPPADGAGASGAGAPGDDAGAGEDGAGEGEGEDDGGEGEDGEGGEGEGEVVEGADKPVKPGLKGKVGKGPTKK